MSNTLSRRDQLLIESYKEQTAAWRHENDLLYRFTTITLPVSIAALAVPYVQKGVPDLLAILGGLTLMMFWALSCQIMQIKSNLRFSIIKEIEECWHIPSHKDCRVIKKNTYGEKRSDRLRSHFLRCCMFWVYLLMVVGLTFCKSFGPCCTQKVLMTEPMDFYVIVGFLGFVAITVGVVTRFITNRERKDKTNPLENGN